MELKIITQNLRRTHKKSFNVSFKKLRVEEKRQIHGSRHQIFARSIKLLWDRLERFYSDKTNVYLLHDNAKTED